MLTTIVHVHLIILVLRNLQMLFDSDLFRIILQNLHQLFDWQHIGQLIGGDFAKFCGLLRIYELYETIFCKKHFFSNFYFQTFYFLKSCLC